VRRRARERSRAAAHPRLSPHGHPNPHTSGPAFHARNNATVLLAPDTPAVRALAAHLAAALACPDARYKRICSPDAISTFGCLFGIPAAPPQCAVRRACRARPKLWQDGAGAGRTRGPCFAPGPASPHTSPPLRPQDPAVCVSDPACIAPALARHILVADSEAAALGQLEDSPVDAVVVFGGGSGGGGEGRSVRRPRRRLRRSGLGDDPPGAAGATGAAARAPADADTAGAEAPRGAAGADDDAEGWQGLLTYAIRMNRTDVPPPGLLRDLFDVAPGEMPLPGNLLWWAALGRGAVAGGGARPRRLRAEPAGAGAAGRGPARALATRSSPGAPCPTCD
jgi:hypothetical protein